MNTFIRCCTTALAAIVLAVGLPPADAYAGGRHGGGYGGGHGHHGGYRSHGPGWGGVGLALGLGLGLGWLGSRHSYAYGPPVYSGYHGAPGYVLIEPPPVVYREAPQVVYREVPQRIYREAPVREPAPASRPDPIIYPRNGQSAEQIEADRQACNRWATTQPNAMADGSVFNRATEACMDGRGYTLR